MKTFKATKGPFAEQPFFTDEEIENTCVDALMSVDLYPSAPAPIRIDRFIEKRFGVTVAYDDLGPGILGYTRFSKTGVTAIVISRALDEEGTEVGERRVRSTLAHEGGHGLFHAHLFAVTGQSSLFPEGTSSAPRVLCRDEKPNTQPGYRGQWWEYQANRAIGSLLLPGRLVRKAITALITPAGALGIESLPNDSRAEAIRRLADQFDVNPVVARHRLDQLMPADSGDQPFL